MILPTLEWVTEDAPGSYSGYVGSPDFDGTRIHFFVSRWDPKPYCCLFVGSSLVGKVSV